MTTISTSSRRSDIPRPGALDPDGATPAPIVTSAVYDTAIGSKSANKPQWITDARGNATAWTYVPEHGGVLTETGPAVNGVAPAEALFLRPAHGPARRRKRGRSAGLAARPNFLCRAGNPGGAGCALGAADEVTTAYDYGPDDGPNNLCSCAASRSPPTERSFAPASPMTAAAARSARPSPAARRASPPARPRPPTTALPFTSSLRYDFGQQGDGHDRARSRRRRPASLPGGAQQLRCCRPADPGRGRRARRLAAGQRRSGAVAGLRRPQDRRHRATTRSTARPARRPPPESPNIATTSPAASKCTAVRMNPDVWATPLRRQMRSRPGACRVRR